MDASSLRGLLEDESVQTITGKFICENENDDLMDMDITNKHFKKCLIIDADFASGDFVDCTFEDAIFVKTAFVAVSFKNCKFIRCKWINPQLDYGMKDSIIENLVVVYIAENSLQEYLDSDPDSPFKKI